MKSIEAGKRIKQRREELGLTQGQLGNMLGFNKSTIQRYETGKIVCFKQPVLQAFAKALNVNPDWLAFKSDIVETAHNKQNTNVIILDKPVYRMITGKDPSDSDVYCPVCDSDQSGYYGEEPPDIVTCYGCGAYLSTVEAPTKRLSYANRKEKQ